MSEETKKIIVELGSFSISQKKVFLEKSMRTMSQIQNKKNSELRSLDDVKLQGQEKLSRNNACKNREARDHGKAKDVLTSASKQVLQKQKDSTILEQCEDDETQRQKMTGHIE